MPPDLNTGVIAAHLKLAGTAPEVSEWGKINYNKGTSSVAQLTNNENGIPSGPAAELGESSCMAPIIFFQIIQYQLNITQ